MTLTYSLLGSLRLQNAWKGGQLNILGHAATLKLTLNETDGEYYVFELVTPPGHGIPPHVHKNEDEVIQVIEGEYEIQLGEQTYQAKAGVVDGHPGGQL